MSPRRPVPLQMEYVILGLALRAPVHGYELLRDWRETYHLDQVWRLKAGSLYAVLEKLERLGFLSSTMVPKPAAPPRKEFRLTPAGETAFRAWVVKPVDSPRQIRQEFMSKLFFADIVGSEACIQLLKAQQGVSQTWLERLKQQSKGAQGFDGWMMDYRARQVRGILDWLEQVISHLESTRSTR